jgi:signal transduction histidine kinase
VLELDQIKLHRIPIYFSEIVDSVILGNIVQANMKSQKLNFKYDSDPIINADPIKIGEAIDNLVSNAIKYSPKDTTIEINVGVKSDKAIFAVKDQGPGLTDEEQKRVFEKFAKLSARPTGGETSTGLGLSICKKLIELHGGKIYAESEGLGKGSTFRVELPLADEKDQKDLELHHGRKGRQTGTNFSELLSGLERRGTSDNINT